MSRMDDWRLYCEEKMSNKECETCKIELTNSEYILRELSVLGYDTKEFCNKKCCKEYVMKKYKIEKRKRWFK